MTALRLPLVLATIVPLAGCGDQWLGEAEDPPLPGERISIMLLDDEITADPALAELEVRLPAPRLNPDWPQAMGNAQHALEHGELGDDLKIAWQRDIGAGQGDGNRLLSAPIIAEGQLFVSDAQGVVSAYNAANGELIWRTSTIKEADSDRLRGGGIATSNGWVFATTGAGAVVGLNANNGDEVWRRELHSPIRTSPTVIGGVVIALTSLNQLVALDGNSGSVLWQHAGFFEQAAILGGAPPASDGRLVIAAYSSGQVFALDLDSGRELWSETILRPRRTLAIGSINDITGAPVIHRNQVLVAGNGGEMAGIDLLSGLRNWEIELTSLQSPWAAGEFVYVLTDRNEVICLLAGTAQARWISPLERLVDPDDADSRRVFWSGPVLAGDRLILTGSTGSAVTLSPYTGEILGKVSLPGPASLPPVVANGTLYILTDNGTLLAYR